ncbi:MAG: MFS transporter [Gammaproteobacteria bacterium]|nr:MFS transporter [Gammaproteobacteria bacterium]
MGKYISLWPYAAANFLFYAFIGGFISYLAILLTERGFNSIEIGQVFAIYTIIRVFTGQLWAHLSDKFHNPLLFFQLGIVFTFLLLLPEFFVESKNLTFLFVVASLTCFMSVVSQLEVLSLLASNDNPKVYNRVRLFGSVGFIVAAVIVGALIDLLGGIFILYFACVCILILLLLSVKIQNQYAETTTEVLGTDDFWPRCRTFGFVSFFIASILLQMSFAPYVGFFTKYLAEQQYQGVAIGALFALGTFSEVFMFMFAGAILARFNVKFLLSVCLFLTAVRWLTQGYLADIWYVMVITQCIHAFSFGLIHSTSIYFIRQHFSKKQQNRGQFMYLGVTFGVGGAIGAWLTGITWQEGAGSTQTFLWAATCSFIAALIIVITPRNNFQYSPRSETL